MRRVVRGYLLRRDGLGWALAGIGCLLFRKRITTGIPVILMVLAIILGSGFAIYGAYLMRND